MPPIIPPRAERFFQSLGGTANGLRGISTQQQIDIATSDGLVVFRTGQLQQYPPAITSPTNYTSGYGWEILRYGSAPSIPVVRGGYLTWVSSHGGTQAVEGMAYLDGGGIARVIMGVAGLSAGWQVFDTSGNLLGNVPYFSGGSYAGIINF